MWVFLNLVILIYVSTGCYTSYWYRWSQDRITLWTLSKNLWGNRVSCYLPSSILHQQLNWPTDQILCFQNFLALCASDYYNGCLFHRNIKGFIVQTGDPTNTGKGGTSVWGKKFADEFKDKLTVILFLVLLYFVTWTFTYFLSRVCIYTSYPAFRTWYPVYG